MLNFIYLRRLCSLSFSLAVHVTFEYHESVTPKRRSRRLQTGQCTLDFNSHFFGSSYKIVFNISEFVIYPPAAEAQYLTFDSIADAIDEQK